MNVDLRLYALVDPAVAGGRTLPVLAAQIAGSATLTVSLCTFTNNVGWQGAGVYSSGTATLTQTVARVDHVALAVMQLLLQTVRRIARGDILNEVIETPRAASTSRTTVSGCPAGWVCR